MDKKPYLSKKVEWVLTTIVVIIVSVIAYKIGYSHAERDWKTALCEVGLGQAMTQEGETFCDGVEKVRPLPVEPSL